MSAWVGSDHSRLRPPGYPFPSVAAAEAPGGPRPEPSAPISPWAPRRRIRFSAGWGTLLTNDFRGCDPEGGTGFDPLSLICKVADADGRPAVKLSDNYAKALGSESEIEHYRGIFGTAGVKNVPVLV